MEYLDTSYIIALSVPTDVNHGVALKLEQLVREPIVSRLVVLELYTYYSRKANEFKEAFSNTYYSDVVDAMVEYSLERARARLVDVSVDNAVKLALKYASTIPLKTLDLLHLVLAYTAGAESLVTLDKDYARFSNIIKEELNMRIIHPWGQQ